MADHSDLLVTELYTALLVRIDARLDDLAKALDPANATATNLPVNAVRWNSANGYFEKWSGSAWARLQTAAADRIAIGLNLVDNTSDASKPVSTATQTALNAKAPLASPALTGTPTAPTATAGTNTTQLATTAFVCVAVAALIDASPSALDTLNELAAALGDDPNFATTMTNALAGKQATLVSGTNIKTVGGISLLGSGNLDITDSCKAWVNFNGTGTVAIREAFNVSSITDNGTGDYTLNIPSGVLPDANYCAVFGNYGDNTQAADSTVCGIISSTTEQGAPLLMTTTQLRVGSNAGLTAASDVYMFNCAIFR